MMQLEDWLDDLCVRFILNLPHEELDSVERICFQIEEAQWFYEDFIRPLDPSLPSLPLRNFSLLIFQHCPLFAAWPPEAFSVSFSQFLAYKTRVPVRGAIMLNEEMDHVVLVKGWKKSANWSFPRGKINKDETDLDCAIREVYEETGYDIRAAGLVSDEKDMKYISVTIREQHLGLYVFRGVPMDTYFEPRTRKEISKIEWWKLSDLPTFKKSKQPNGAQESLAVNANKFYMVAPFLNDLRKWINRQRKRDAVEGRHLASRPILVEQAEATEDEPDLIDVQAPELAQALPTPSDLPEVSLSEPVNQDPSAHLKALLKIAPHSVPANEPPLHNPQTNSIDQDKSTALLNLLRGGPSTSFQQSGVHGFVPQGQGVDPASAPQVSHPDQYFSRSTQGLPLLQSGHNPPSKVNPSVMKQPISAPYHRTGDPSFARARGDEVQGPAVPPASSLPSLSKHAQSLLDAFKTKPSSQSTALPDQPNRIQHDPTLQRSNGFPPQTNPLASSVSPPATAQKKPPAHQNNLLDLFRQGPSQTTKLSGQPPISNVRPAPVELAADPATVTPRSRLPPQKDLLVQLLQRKASESSAAEVSQRSTPVTNPRLSPQFDAMQQIGNSGFFQSGEPIPHGIGKSVPQEPKRMTILQRPPKEENSAPYIGQAARDYEKQLPPAQAPPSAFQPQILQRPPQQPSRSVDSHIGATQMNGRNSYSSNSAQQSFDKRTSQSDAHKQSLLSLFGKSPSIDPTEPLRRDSLASNAVPSPASLISPVNMINSTVPIDPNVRISPPERSRMGSESSFGGMLTPTFTRTTKPDERKFLLDLMTKGHAS